MGPWKSAICGKRCRAAVKHGEKLSPGAKRPGINFLRLTAIDARSNARRTSKLLCGRRNRREHPTQQSDPRRAPRPKQLPIPPKTTPQLSALRNVVSACPDLLTERPSQNTVTHSTLVELSYFRRSVLFAGPSSPPPKSVFLLSDSIAGSSTTLCVAVQLISVANPTGDVIRRSIRAAM